MKNLKKISLISFLACATLAGGILTANTEVETPVQEQKFYMVDGAQVRVPDVVEEGAEDFDGLRFTAKMTDAYRVAKGELENMQVGMFIYPTAYADGEHDVNYDNCFGENACYYWAGNDADTEGKKQILHVEAYAYEEVAGADELTIQASVWNMLPANLGLDFSAVAYLKVTNGESVEYHFAETGAGAKAVSVAQKALLNKEDAIHEEEGAADRVNAAYVTPFLGEEGVEVAYTETIYKQQKDGSYALIEENVEKTGVVKAYNTQAPKAYDNYAVYSRESTARNLLIDGSANITTYYNYAGNRVVIWDGDENTAPESYLKTQEDSNLQAFRVESDSIYEGNYGWMYNIDGWDGPSWPAGKVLPAATDTLSMVLEVGGDVTTGKPTEFKGWTLGFYTGVKSGWVSVSTITAENLATGEVITEYAGTDGSVVDLPTGLYKVTAKFAKEVSIITSIGFLCKLNEGCPVIKVDNICAEIQSVGKIKLARTYTDSISFKMPEILDTTVWEGEASELVPTVQYKSNLATDYSDLTAQDGVYTITPDAEAYKYEIVVNGESHITIKGNIWADFDKATAERDYVVADTYNGTGLWDSSDQSGWIVSVDGFDGKFMSANISNAWVYIQYKESAAAESKTFAGINGGVAPTKLGAWIYAPEAFTFDCTARVWGNFGYGVGSIEIQAGYHYYEIGLPANWGSQNAMMAFVINYSDYYIDALVVY